MAHYTIGPIVFPTIGPLLDSIRTYLRDQVAALATGERVWSLSVGYLYGVGGVQLDDTPTGEGDSYTQLFMVLEVQESSTIPVQQFVSNPGFDAEATSYAYNSVDNPSWTLQDVEDLWVAQMLTLKQDMIDTWTTGTSGTTTTANAEPVAGNVRRSTSYFPVDDDSGVYVSNERLLITLYTDDSETSFDTTRYVVGLQTSSPCVTIDTNRIATALEQILLLPSEISFNYGATVWSVNGGFLVSS